MKQLSGADALFLQQEHGNQMAHVAGLAIYDPSTAPGGKVRFKAILDFFTQRIQASPVFRRRLVHAPMNLDRPYWIEDGEIDVEYHVRHIALPYPGDWRQLMIQIARIHSRGLDLSKPAWEVYIIEGLNNIPGVPEDSFAMYIKFHHAAVDGQAGAALVGALHSLTPVPEQSSRTAVTIADRPPTGLELMARMVGNRAKQVRSAVELAASLTPMLVAAGRQQIEGLLKGKDKSSEVREFTGTSRRAPPTRFNGKLSPHRAIEAMPISMSDISAIRAAMPGVTVNDVFLSICGGAVRSYLLAKGELPEVSLNALMPMSTRPDKPGADAGNQIGMATLPVYTQIATAAERLEKVSAGSSRGKKKANAVGKDLPARVFQILPSVLIDLALRQFILPSINLTVSNVRGPDVPLYLAGAKLHMFMPINMLLDGMGLSITGFSYNGQLWVCVVADRKMLPDPGFFAQCYQTSIAEHLALAKGPAPKVAAPKAAAPKSPAKAATKPAAKRAAKPVAKAAEKAPVKRSRTKAAAKA